MFQLNEELLKCSLILGALFVVFSHPYLYRALHRQFSNVLAFVDMNSCPTEGGVFVHAVLFALVVYFGKTWYEKNYGKKQVKVINNNNVNVNSNDNVIKNKCKVYCESISNEMKNNNSNLPTEAQLQVPNNLNTNNIPQVNTNNLINAQKNLPNLPNINNITNNNMNNNNMNNNNMNVANNNGMNMTNNMDYNNVSNIMGTQSTEINNLGNNQNNLGNNMNNLGNNLGNNQNNLGMANNQPQLSCGAGVPNFTNQLSDSDMFMENTTYVDDVYMKL